MILKMEHDKEVPYVYCCPCNLCIKVTKKNPKHDNICKQFSYDKNSSHCYNFMPLPREELFAWLLYDKERNKKAVKKWLNTTQ
jgi:hypothetical protein